MAKKPLRDEKNEQNTETTLTITGSTPEPLAQRRGSSSQRTEGLPSIIMTVGAVIISIMVVLTFCVTMYLMFNLLSSSKSIDNASFGLLMVFATTITNAFLIVVGFWVGSSSSLMVRTTGASVRASDSVPTPTTLKDVKL